MSQKRKKQNRGLPSWSSVAFVLDASEAFIDPEDEVPYRLYQILKRIVDYAKAGGDIDLLPYNEADRKLDFRRLRSLNDETVRLQSELDRAERDLSAERAIRRGLLDEKKAVDDALIALAADNARLRDALEDANRQLQAAEAKMAMLRNEQRVPRRRVKRRVR